MIIYENVCKNYNSNKIVKNINLTISKGEFVVLIGPSGCGKTTTLKMLNRLIKCSSGSIFINGKNTLDINPETLRQSIGYVIQQIGLFPNMTVEENISVVPKLLKWDKERCAKRVYELLKLVDMPYEQYAKKYPNQMSGGQQQRVGVLRSLAAEPPIILMDEPFGALDPITRDSLQDEIKMLQTKLGITIIFVTHDMDEAIKLADTIVFMDKGEIIQVDSPEDMLKSPATNIIKEFMGKYTNDFTQDDFLCSDVAKTKVVTVNKNKKTLECVSVMKKYDIDSLIIVDEEKNFEGILTIEDIKEKGKPGHEIHDIITDNVFTVSIDTPAKEAFDMLIKNKLDYVVVLDNNKVHGIITKTSMSKALANVVWGN